MKKRVVSLLSLVMVVSLLLAACSQKNEASETGSSTDTSEAGGQKPVEISIFAQQESGIDLINNGFSKFLENKFNAKFNWQIIPTDGAKEKRQISLASGDYPDSYMLTGYIDQFSQADVLKYGKQGVILPLNDLIDQYAPNIKAAIESNESLRSFVTAPDGNIYGLVAYSECFHCSYPNKMWINTKWLEKLKLEMPKTTEDFKKVLEAFKNNDPNGNGKADEVPLSGSTEDFGVRIVPYLMNGFIYDDDNNYLQLANGKVDTVANKPEWKEGLAYIKSLYDEGLIDSGAFTQNAEAFKKIGENANDEILGAGAGMHPAIFVDKRTKDYNPLPPLTGPYASYATHNGSGIAPGAKFVITNKASKEAQIALIKMVDFMYTPEGQTIAIAGQEGEGWRKPKEGEEALGQGVTPQIASIQYEEGKGPKNYAWSGMGHIYMTREYRDSYVAAKDIYAPDGYERRLYDATLLYEGKEPKELFPYWAIWMDPTETDEASMLQTNIKSYIEQSTLQFITGNKDLNKDWDSYVKGLDKLNVNRYLEIMQKAYDTTFKK
ncbi:ABC transporter substrate-binding protein [Paenibacillus selenitireducens]|uniref:ABC transporter substrate-binding protein n=1 Tax=Paenibacillus selenitireducens TaxID=1324314 RepID=A0A1T2X296_9BACL|nr:ABC transporter substrate-binding protein [Paenibacillus selenitireducens]